MTQTKIFLATDHAGFALKEFLKEHLQRAGHSIEDCGAYAYEKADDYPDFIKKAALGVQKDPETKAILLGYSGQGEAMIANRYKGVRAAVYYGGTQDIILLSREHNNANVLSLGAGFLSNDEALSAVSQWLDTPFTNEERHARRIRKIDESH